MSTESSPEKLERFGFRFESGSAHMARTMMLSELTSLLEYVAAPGADHARYVAAIEQDNCLGKRSGRSRQLSKRHLTDLYALDPAVTLFRALLYFWNRDPQAHPLLACLCACARDPLLRASAAFVLGLEAGQSFSREALEEDFERKFPARFSPATLKSTTQNLASTWTQSGHLTGRVNKRRSRARATAGGAAYALFLGYLAGARGENLFVTEYARLLDSPPETVVELAESASRRGWIVFNRVGSVSEVLFPMLLTPEEMGWIREQS